MPAATICRVSSGEAPAEITASSNWSRAMLSKGAPNNKDVSESTSACKLPVDTCTWRKCRCETSKSELRLGLVSLISARINSKKRRTWRTVSA